MDFATLLTSRYTCKHYDPNKKISKEDFEKILEAGRLSPSAVNLQPWHFFVASTPEAKAKIKDAVMPMNMERFENCSHVVVLCAKTDATLEYISKVVDKEDADGRFGRKPEAKVGQDAGKKNFSSMHRISASEIAAWNARNTYITLASMLYQAHDLGIDSTAVEGMYPQVADDLLKLKEQGLTCLCMIFFGYRSKDDSNVLENRPKSRLDLKDVVTYL